MRMVRAFRSCVAFGALLFLSVFASPTCAEQHSVSITDTNYHLMASPFATPAGAPLAFSNLVKSTNGAFIFWTWDSTAQTFAPASRFFLNSWSFGGSTTVARGRGFWVRKDSGSAYDIVFTGSLTTAQAVTNRMVSANPSSLHLVGYPYLAAVALTNLNLTNDIRPYVTGTTLYVYNSTARSYRVFFFDADGSLGGGWQDADDPGQPTDYVLQPMEGFWIWMLGQTSLVWRALAP